MYSFAQALKVKKKLSLIGETILDSRAPGSYAKKSGAPRAYGTVGPHYPGCQASMEFRTRQLISGMKAYYCGGNPGPETTSART